MTNETETLTSGIDPASFSSVIKPTNDLFRYVNGPWIDTYRLPDDRSRYGNRNNSTDSRDSRLGIVDERYILGHVLRVVFPFSEFGSVE